MSRKHNTKHPERGRSRYPERLAARGLSKAPALAVIEGDTGLRARQRKRVERTCTLGDNHRGHVCDGVPWLRRVGDAPVPRRAAKIAEAAERAEEPTMAELTAKLASHYATAV